MLLNLSDIALIEFCFSFTCPVCAFFTGQKMGFLVYWNVEHCCMAHALELLF